MLDFRDLGLEGIGRLCQADLSWELVPLHYCPGKEGKACIVFVCFQLAILMVSSTSTPLQILIFINGNKMVAQFVNDSKSRVHSFLFKGSPVGLTIDANFDYRDSIAIVEITITILSLSWHTITILSRYYRFFTKLSLKCVYLE